MENNTYRSRPGAGVATVKFRPLALAFAVSLAAAPVNASITLPTDPLTTSARVAPNILFILDDSGSMGWDYMPDTVPSFTNGTSGRSAYTLSSVYYNPYKDYQPWMNADGSLMTGGTSYASAFSDANLASGNTTNLRNSRRTFYVPVNEDMARNPQNYSSANLRNIANYYRFEIHTDGRVVRSRYGTRVVGLSNRNCSTSSTGWGSCEYLTPTGRTEAQELENFATWYSYHRTRMKAAKAGASQAFSELGTDVRVGFRTIWGRNGSQTNQNWPTEAKPIPVDYNSGLFDDPNGASGSNNNRTRWYQRLQAVTSSGGTPLHGALHRAGQYFSNKTSSGPYGPESGSDQLSCRQNFSILTTDGFWNSQNYSPGEQDNTAGDLIEGVGGKSYRYQPRAPYASSDANTLADVAMQYWKTDLRDDLENNVPTTGANPAFWQHMVTFGISIGLKGTVDQTSVAQVVADGGPRINGAPVAWPRPSNDSIANIDDLLHAALNGRGEFVAASDPDAFASGLKSALAAITERTGSFSNVAANSTSVDGGTRIYQASYVSGVWTGEVQAYPITSDGKVSVTAAWNASAGISAVGRKVFSGNDTGTAAVAFPSGISEQRLAQLARTGVINYPVSGAENAAYLAGAQQLEMRNGGTLRNRNHLLGDIVSSSPAYVSDTETLYVGGNDGMLHALDATNGRELFAYIPSGINWSDLAGLSRPDYSHRFFVDGPVVVSTRVQTANKNILVGALGKGGKGLYALDVTSPSSFSASDFKWEVGGSSALMGLVQARPLITKLNNGKTAVVVANGINSASGRAALLIYDIDTGALIKSIDTGVGSSTVDSPAANGLTSVVGWDADGNGTVDAVYGGDMLGNIWKFDLGQGATSGWGVHEDKPLFTATGPDGTVQPVTGGLTLALHPRTYQPWLFFGTGRLLTAGDMTSADVQSLYGMVDDGSAKLRSGAGANLTQRSIVEATTLEGFPVRAFERRQPLPPGSKGWYIDLLKPPVPGTAEGERAVSDAQLYGDVLIISTVIPTADACQADGRGYINAIDAYTGTSTGPSLFDLNGNGSFDDETIGDDDLPVGSVDLGVGMPTLAEILRGLAVVGGSSGNLGNVPIREARNVGRVSWREVLQN